MTGNRAAYDVTSDDWKEVVKLNYGYSFITAPGQRWVSPPGCTPWI